MLEVHTTQVRPSAEVSFFTDANPDKGAQFLDLVSKTLNMVNYPTFEVSQDGLTQLSIATYEDQDQLSAFLQELAETLPTFMDERDAHSTKYGITIAREEKTV